MTYKEIEQMTAKLTTDAANKTRMIELSVDTLKRVLRDLEAGRLPEYSTIDDMIVNLESTLK